jgi:DNA-binding NtrC family response regulator
MTARVLVVDDERDAEPLFRQQFRREVREGLYQLDFARSGETPLHMLDGCVGDEIILLLLDIDMPGMGGLDVLPKIKGRKPGLPVFVISAYGPRRESAGLTISSRSRWISRNLGGASCR